MKSPISLIEPWFHYLATKTRYILTGSLLNFSNLQKVECQLAEILIEQNSDYLKKSSNFSRT